MQQAKNFSHHNLSTYYECMMSPRARGPPRNAPSNGILLAAYFTVLRSNMAGTYEFGNKAGLLVHSTGQQPSFAHPQLHVPRFAGDLLAD